MRILYFSRDYTTHDRRFLEKLGASEHEVWFLRLEDDGLGYEQRTLPTNVHFVEWINRGAAPATPEACLRLMPEYVAILNRLKPDVVHAGPVPLCGFMTALADYHPHLVVSWGSDILLEARSSEKMAWVALFTLERSDMLFCDCDAVRTRVQQILPYRDADIVQFPWGIDLEQFRKGSNVTPLQGPPEWADAFVVLSTRSWEPMYGIDVLLLAFAKARSQNSRLRLILLGNGSREDEIGQIIKYHRLDAVIFRPGRVSQAEIPRYFRQADLYLSCAHSDGSSISLIEAMASGLPVIVTDVPGNREWVTPGENGWLAPDNDADACSELILRAASLDKKARHEIAALNRHVVESRANWNGNFPKLLAAYQRMDQTTRETTSHASSDGHKLSSKRIGHTGIDL